MKYLTEEIAKLKCNTAVSAGAAVRATAAAVVDLGNCRGSGLWWFRLRSVRSSKSPTSKKDRGEGKSFGEMHLDWFDDDLR